MNWLRSFFQPSYKVQLLLEVEPDSDLWVTRTVYLPFQPTRGMTIEFSETSEESSILTDFTVEDVCYNVNERQFHCMGVCLQHPSDMDNEGLKALCEDLLSHGWQPHKSITWEKL